MILIVIQPMKQQCELKKWQIEVSLNNDLMYAYGQTKPGIFDTYILFYFCDSVSL